MPRKARFVLLLLSVFALLSFVVPLSAQSGITLVVFGPSMWDTFAPGASADVINDVTAKLDAGFKALHPEVTEIKHDAQGQVADGLSRLMNAQLAGDPVDLIMCAANPVNTSYVSKNLILPVDDLAAKVKDRYNPGAFDPFTIDGKIWGIPLSGVSSTTFFYNKTLFAKLGIEAPKTYDDFVKIAATIKASGVTPVLHQGKNAWMWPIWYMSTLAETTSNTQLDKTRSNLRGTTKFTDAADVDAMKWVRKFVDDGILDPASMDLDEEGMRSAFLSGKSAAYFGATWDLPILRDNVKDFELGVFKFPDIGELPGKPQTYGGVEVGLCLSSTVSDANRQAALDYVDYVTQPEQAKLSLGPLNPIATSHKDIAGADDDIAKQIRAEYLPTGLFLDWIWPRELTDTIQRELQDVVSGAATPEAAMQAIQDKYDQMVADGYKYPY